MSYHTVDGSFELYEVPVPKCESDSVKGHELFTGNDGDFRVEGGILTEYSGSDRNIIIPGSVRKIGENAFNGSENLRDIYFEGTKESWEAIDTENVVIPSECEIHFQ